ncbi:hypothetical protein BDQ12DRAFT_731924 [Crucibulum laeve]|uniref:Uncharacterized protein n=1 Tax=Crucibulum laeve TaxID=68775 RepID=A0A5C3MFG4_9AGAR|nr:hypothetical protein BDQ12DRAFT_731924 [Crucibulum laeve]
MSWSSDSDSRQIYAPAVSTGGFFYRGRSFYVGVDGFQHGRADPADLHALLTYTPPPPVLTKAGKVAKRQPVNTHKEKEAHFYCAQLLHYGLKPLKTREPAKKKLLAAFEASGGKTLAVPPQILELEKTLKEQWKAANSMAKKKFIEEEKTRALEAEKRSKQKKALQEADMKKFLEGTSQPIAGTSGDPFELGEESDNSVEIIEVPKSMTKPQLRNAITTLSEDRLRAILTKLLDDVPAVQKILKNEIDNTMKSSKSVAKSAPKGKKTATKTNSLDVSGSYDILAPALSDNWACASGPMTLKINPSSTSAHLWGKFDFGIISGVIRTEGPPPSAANVRVSFRWRGREAGEDVMTFGECNKGTMTFLADGKIKGYLEGDLCTSEFVGRPSGKGKTGLSVKEVQKWKREWRSINEVGYEKENRGRWNSGWGGDHNSVEGPAASDTTEGGGEEDLYGEESYNSEPDFAF